MRHVGCEINPPNETLDSQLTFLNAETGLHYEEDVLSQDLGYGDGACRS